MSTVGELGNGPRRRGITRVKFAANPMKLNVVNVLRKRKQKRNGNYKEMRHKKQRRSDIGNIDMSSDFHDDSAIICEILSRLPVKSLARCKCVCKRWRFLIEEDSYFIDLHHHQSKNRPILFSIVPLPDKYSRIHLPDIHKVELMTVNLNLEGRGTGAPSVRSIGKMQFSPNNAYFFGPVNGLIGYQKHSAIRICNISTEELTPWIKSTLSRNDEEEERTPHYELGFDPVTKKHKVICIWHILELNEPFLQKYMCEVLTVGDNKWRWIELPPFGLILERYHRRHTLYLNGFIYYCTSNFVNAGEPGYDKIVAFDVGAEKFREVTVSNFILNQPRHFYEDGICSNNFIEMEGRLALISRMDDYTAKLWVCDDVLCNNEEKNAGTSCSSNPNWTEVTIELPYLWSADLDLYFHSLQGTDQVIIESHCKERISALHFYNWKTKSCKKIDIRGFKSCRPSTSRVATLVESLFRVK